MTKQQLITRIHELGRQEIHARRQARLCEGNDFFCGATRDWEKEEVICNTLRREAHQALHNLKRQEG